MRDREQPTDSATVELRIEGMDCAEEVAVLTRELAQMVGGEENLAFDLLNAKLIATLPPGCSGEDVVAAIRKTGMRAVPFVETESEPESVRRWSIHSLLTVLSGSALAFGIFIQVVSAGGGADVFGDGSSELPQIATLLSRALYLLGIGSGLALVGPKAWFSARRLRPDMNLLMTIAVVGALVIDEWFEAAAVSFLFALSLELEAWSLERARRAVSMLMELAPASVLLVAEDGTRAETSPDDVRPGATFLVRPGDRIALDGEVLEGESAVDQSPITGESLPAAKSVGMRCSQGQSTGREPSSCVPRRPPTTRPSRVPSGLSARRIRDVLLPSNGLRDSQAYTRQQSWDWRLRSSLCLSFLAPLPAPGSIARLCCSSLHVPVRWSSQPR